MRVQLVFVALSAFSITHSTDGNENLNDSLKWEDFKVKRMRIVLVELRYSCSALCIALFGLHF